MRLQLGKVMNPNQSPAPAAEQFTGYLGEVILYSSVLKNDQIQLLEAKVLREHYIQGPLTTIPVKK